MTDDRTLLVEALGRLAAAIDAKDWPAIAASFTEDAEGYGARGRDAIVARMRDHLGGCGPTQHLLGNHRVTVDGDSARSLSYARVHHVGAGPKAGAFFECMGEYDDHWARTAQGWLLTSRSFDMRIQLGDFDVLRPARPEEDMTQTLRPTGPVMDQTAMPVTGGARADATVTGEAVRRHG